MKKLPWCLVGFFVLCLCVSLFHNVKSHSHITNTSDTITLYDTLLVEHPVPKDSIIVRYRTITFPAKHDTIFAENIAVRIDTVTDSVTVTLPITQKEYGDSSYHAWISGYQPSLDSIAVFPKTTIITNTQTIVEKKRWGVGIQMGIGISTDKQVHPYLGIGLHYNIFSW